MAVHAKDLATPQVKIWFTQRRAWTKHPAAAIRFSIWGAATRFTGYRDGIRLRPLHFVRLYQQCISFELVKLILDFVVSPCLGPWKQFMVTIDDVWLYSTWPTWLMPPICPWNTPGSYATVAGNVLPWVRCVSWTSLARTGGGESCWVPSAALSIFVGFRWLSG